MNSNTPQTLPVSENGKENNPVALKIRSFDLFEDRLNYMNGTRVYYAYFEMIPSLKIINNIKHLDVIKWVETKLAGQIVKTHLREEYSASKKEMETLFVLFILKNKLLVRIENNRTACVYFTEENRQEAQLILDGFKKFSRRVPSESYVQLVVPGSDGLDLEMITNKKAKLVLEENYNDDLIPIHKLVVKELKGNGNNGLVLFHGKPGTGKSTYLRHLIHLMRRKSIILISPKLAAKLDAPELTKLLVQNRDSILIIEDAEELITSRGIGNDSSISMLLNLTDGILGESLGIHVICTFNTELKNIDKALLRKGRLTALYEFNALSIEKSKVLLKKLGVDDSAVTSPMTLADIYHAKDTDFKLDAVNHKPVGFAIDMVN
ncbi:MAG: AAA family ATPase [Bacteroidia bacterium]